MIIKEIEKQLLFSLCCLHLWGENNSIVHKRTCIVNSRIYRNLCVFNIFEKGCQENWYVKQNVNLIEIH
jgi:hypothetical protein